MARKIVIAGDWHINTEWATLALDKIASTGIKEIYHVGDFGFWPDEHGQDYLQVIDAKLALTGSTLLVTPGNHDDYAFINSLSTDENGFLIATDHVKVLPRGHRWAVDGVSFVSLGGAASIDFETRTEGMNWWREEAITYGDVMRTAGGGSADVMIAHDAPNGVNALSLTSKADTKKHSPEALMYSSESRYMMTHAVDGVRPKVFFHGHYHNAYMETANLGLPQDSYDVRSIGLGKDYEQGNLAVMDLSDLSVSFLD
jgi:hypothetical protein